MIKYKKAFGIVAFTMRLLFTFIDNAYCFTDNKTVSPSKTWRIYFNGEMCIDDLNKESIIVKESNKVKLADFLQSNC